MSATVPPSEESRSALQILVLFLTALVGAGSAIALVDLRQSRRAAEGLEREQASIHRHLIEIARRLDPLEALPRHLNRVVRHLRQHGFEPAAFTGAERLLRRAPVSVAEIYLFDAAGRLVTPRATGLRYRWLMQRFWDIQTGRLTPSSPEFRRCSPSLLSRLGLYFLASGPGRHPQNVLIQKMGGDEKTGFWLWFRPLNSDLRGALILLEEPVAAARHLTSLFRRFKGSRGILFFREGRAKPVLVCGTASADRLARLAQWQRDTGEQAFVQDDVLWQALPLGDMTLFLGRPSPRNLVFPWSIGVPSAILGAMAAVAVVMLLFRLERFSLLIKIPALFLIALALPGIGIGFFGWENLRNLRENGIRRFEREAGDLLNTLDRRFLEERARMKALFQDLEQDEALARGEIATFSRRLQTSADKGQIGLAKIFELDPRRKTLAEVCHFSFSSDQQSFDWFTKAGLETHLQDRLRRELASYVSEIPQAMLKIARGPFSGVSEVMMRPGQMHLFSEGIPLWIYQRFFTRPGFPAGGLLFIVPLELVRWDYLRLTMRRRFTHRSWPVLVGAVSPTGGNGFSQVRTLPHGLSNLLFESRIRQGPIGGRVEWNRRSYHAICLPGSKLEGFTLFALLPMRFLHREYAAFRLGVVMSLLLLAGFGAVIGILLSHLFIRPIGHLSRGLAALRQRNRDFRIQEISPDELGDLATAFNQFLETAAELELAGIIQNRLVPRDWLTVGSYRIGCRYLPATELAGDYVDYFPLADGNVVVLIGDVSGHGVRSALLMAMVKGALQAALRRSCRPEDVVSRLNRFVFHSMKRRLFMTFFFAIVDPRNHRITYCDAGHPYPLLHSPGMALRELGSPGLPLGASLKSEFHSAGFAIEPEQTLLLFSDGLYEAVSRTGEMYGFDRIRRILERDGHKDPGLVLAGLESNFQMHLGDQPLPDDMSLLILKRPGFDHHQGSDGREQALPHHDRGEVKK